MRMLALLATLALSGCATTQSVMEKGPRTEVEVAGDWQDVYASIVRDSRDCLRGIDLGMLGQGGYTVTPLQTRERGEVVYDQNGIVFTVVYVEPDGENRARVTTWGPTQVWLGWTPAEAVLSHVRGEKTICQRVRG